MRERIETHASRAFLRNAIDLHFIVRHQDGAVSVATDLTFRKLDEGQLTPETPLALHLDDAQRLMDELWRVGLRPSEGTGSAGSLAATERHLKDMQTVALALLRKDGCQL